MEALQVIGWSIVSFLVVLGILIFIHELGHYLMAKWLGIRVEVFSLGFGPRLFGFRRGETDYRVSAVPLGGYVKMAGENPDEELTGAEDEFLSRPKLHRFAVAVAGPLMNIGLAFLLLTAYFLSGVPVPAYRSQPAVIERIEEGSAAARAGLQVGDRIVAINGRSTPTWAEVELEVAARPNQRLILTLEREGERLEKEVVTDVREGLEVGSLGVAPYLPYVLQAVEPDSPAQRAGLQAGDEILEVRVGEEKASGLFDIPPFIARHEGTAILFRVRRGDKVFDREIQPVLMGDRARVGIVAQGLPVRVEQYGVLEALRRSLRTNYQITVLLFDILGRIITGEASLRTLSGPIEIARFSGTMAAQGLGPLIHFMALISLQLGIINLLPIPVLDGGVIALLMLEGILRRDLSLKVKERIFQIGFIFLILLMSIVIFNDIHKTLDLFK